MKIGSDGIPENFDTTTIGGMSFSNNWGMYTCSGNHRLHRIAVTCVKKADRAQGDRNKVKKALTAYVTSWERICNDRSKDIEASDTVVREAVAYHHAKVYSQFLGESAGFDLGYDLFNDNRNIAYRRLQNATIS